MSKTEFLRLNKISRVSSYLAKERNNIKFRLDKNENTYDKLYTILKKIIKKINHNDINSYPNLKQLYNIISKIEKIDKKNILLTAGADTAIKLIFETLIKKKDKIVITDPSFAMYKVYAELFETTFFKIKYVKESNSFKLNIDKLFQVINQKKIKALFLPNPDSPTGHAFSYLELKKIIHFCKLKSVYLIIDEAYFPFYKCTSINFIKKYENLIIVRTGSKSFGLAGLRVGFIASNSKIISLISKYRPIYEIGNLSSKFYIHLYKNINLINKITNEQIIIKKNFENFLRKLNFEVMETNANFVLVNFRKKKDKIEKIINKIAYIKNNVYIDKKNYSRITITDNYKIAKLKKLINNAK